MKGWQSLRVRIDVQKRQGQSMEENSNLEYETFCQLSQNATQSKVDPPSTKESMRRGTEKDAENQESIL
jgi:hypothetical protein